MTPFDQDPDNELAKWDAGVLAGLPAPLPTGLQDINCRGFSLPFSAVSHKNTVSGPEWKVCQTP